VIKKLSRMPSSAFTPCTHNSKDHEKLLDERNSSRNATGIEHVESKSIQGVGLIKLQFHPGTNMAQAVAETVSYVDRARAFMPTGTVPPTAGNMPNSCAACWMIAGMIPMALGEGGEQTAPLGRAVIGGLIGATCATLIVLPTIFATLQSRHARISASLDPDDLNSPYFEPGPAASPQKSRKSRLDSLIAG
jgi:hypothetical protein